MVALKYIIALITIIASVQVAFAKPKAKQAPPPSTATAEKSQLEEIFANAQSAVEKFSETIGVKELPDTKQVANVLSTNIKELANYIGQAVEKIKTEVKAHEPEFKKALKTVEQQLTDTAHSLETVAGPEATARAKELQTSLNNGLKTTVAQFEDLIKAVQPDAARAKTDIQNTMKTILDNIVDFSNNVQETIKQTLVEHEKTHNKQ